MKKNNLAFLILVSIIIWTGVIIATAIELKGTPYRETVSNYLIGGVIAHLIFIWTPLAKYFKKLTGSKSEE